LLSFNEICVKTAIFTQISPALASGGE